MPTGTGAGTWNRQYGGLVTLNSVEFVDGLNGWAVGQFGTILHTSDDASWAAQNSGTFASLGGVEFVSTTHYPGAVNLRSAAGPQRGAADGRGFPAAPALVPGEVDRRRPHSTDELKALLAAQLDRIRSLERKTGSIIPFLFPHLAGHWQG
jgi:hypothetical protein